MTNIIRHISRPNGHTTTLEIAGTRYRTTFALTAAGEYSYVCTVLDPSARAMCYTVYCRDGSADSDCCSS